MTTDTEFFYEGRDLEALSDMPRYYQWITAHFSPYLRGDVVEIGAGIGTISKMLLPAVASLDLVEPSANLVGRLNDTFNAEPRIRIFGASLTDYVRGQPTDSRDAVIMVNVLEHIEDDIDALRSIVSLLRPGGHLLLFVPAMPFLYSDLDRLLGHYRRYTRPRLKGVLSETEFDVVRIRYFDLLGMISLRPMFDKDACRLPVPI